VELSGPGEGQHAGPTSTNRVRFWGTADQSLRFLRPVAFAVMKAGTRWWAGGRADARAEPGVERGGSHAGGALAGGCWAVRQRARRRRCCLRPSEQCGDGVLDRLPDRADRGGVLPVAVRRTGGGRGGLGYRGRDQGTGAGTRSRTTTTTRRRLKPGLRNEGNGRGGQGRRRCWSWRCWRIRRRWGPGEGVDAGGGVVAGDL